LDSAAALYLELMKKCLTNTIYDDPDLMPVTPRGFLKQQIVKAFRRTGITLATAQPASETRGKGLYNNPHAHTMIGIQRLTNIQRCVERVLADQVQGDLIETGVWRGGCCIFMRGLLAGSVKG